ncbi:MAG: tetratricopeptide repeat protein [Thermodesulfobacteriota bacterium]
MNHKNLAARSMNEPENGGIAATTDTRQKVVYGLLLCALVCSLFWPAVFYRYANYDDQTVVFENPILKEPGLSGLRKVFSFFSIKSFYPMRLASFAVDHALWGLDPSGYHLTNILIHLLNVLLVYTFFLRAFPRTKGGGAAFAFFTAAFFGLHPSVVDSVAWIAGREELLMLFFLLCGLHFTLNMPAQGEKRLLRHVLIAYLGAFSCLSNIYGAVFPALAVLGYRLCGGERGAVRLIRLTWYLWLIAGAAFFIKLVSLGVYDQESNAVLFPFVPEAIRNAGTLLSKTYHETLASLPVADRVRLIIGLYGLNVLHLLAPLWLPVMYQNMYPASYWSAPVLAGLAAAAITAVAVYRARKDPLPLFCLGWFLIALAPGAQIVPHHIYRADRFLYLPLIGFFGALCYPVLSASRRRGETAGKPAASTRTGARALLLVYLGLLAARAAMHLPVWSDPLTLHSYCVKQSPDFYLVHQYLAAELFNERDYDRSAAEYEKALRLDPSQRYQWMNMVKALTAGGRIAEAEERLRKGLAENPEDYVLWNDLGLVLGQRQKFDESVEAFRKGIPYAPNKAVLHLNIAANYIQRHLYEQAFDELARAREADPKNAFVLYQLGLAMERRGDLQQALSLYRQAARLAPGYLAPRSRERMLAEMMRQAQPMPAPPMEAPGPALGGIP